MSAAVRDAQKSAGDEACRALGLYRQHVQQGCACVASWPGGGRGLKDSCFCRLTASAAAWVAKSGMRGSDKKDHGVGRCSRLERASQLKFGCAGRCTRDLMQQVSASRSLAACVSPHILHRATLAACIVHVCVARASTSGGAHPMLFVGGLRPLRRRRRSLARCLARSPASGLAR